MARPWLYWELVLVQNPGLQASDRQVGAPVLLGYVCFVAVSRQQKLSLVRRAPRPGRASRFQNFSTVGTGTFSRFRGWPPGAELPRTTYFSIRDIHGVMKNERHSSLILFQQYTSAFSLYAKGKGTCLE